MKQKTSLAAAMRAAAEQPSTPKTSSRRGKKAVVVYLEPDIARELRVLAAQNDTSLQALGVEALTRLLERYAG